MSTQLLRETITPSQTKAIVTTATRVLSSSTPSPSITPTQTSIPSVRIGTPFPIPSQSISKVNVSRIIELTRWGKGLPLSVVYKPDGSSLLVITSLGIDIYDAETYVLTKSIDFDSMPDKIAFHPNGKEIVVNTSTDIYVINLHSGEMVNSIPHKARAISISVDGEEIYFSTCSDPRIEEVFKLYIFDTKSSRIIEIQESEACIRQISPSSDGEFLAFRYSSSVTMWSIPDQQEVASIGPFPISSTPFDVFYTLDSEQLIIVSYSMIYIVDKQTGEIIQSLKPRFSYAQTVSGSLSPDNLRLTTASDHISVWNLTTYTLSRVIDDRFFWFESVAWSPDNESIAFHSTAPEVGSKPGVIIWDLASDSRQEFLDGYTYKVDALAWSSDNRTIAIGYGDGWLRIIDLEENQERTELQFEDIWVSYAIRSAYTDLSFSTEGDFLGLGVHRSPLLILDISNNEYIYPIDRDAIEGLNQVIYSTDSKYFASSSYDGGHKKYQIRVWNIPEWNLIQSWELEAGGAPPTNLQFDSTNKKLLLGYSSDRWHHTEVISFDILSGRLQTIFQAPDESYSFDTYAVSPDGKSIITSTREGSCFLYREDSEPIRVNIPTSNSFGGFFGEFLSWSPTDELIAFGSLDGKIYLIDGNNGDVLRTIDAHTDALSKVSFSPDGSMIATGSLDGTVRIWGITQ